MKKWGAWLMFMLACFCCLAAQAETHPLCGTWRFAGGAEVRGYGFQLLEDGTFIQMNTDDFDHFPTERLFPMGERGTWKEHDGVVTFVHPDYVVKYPWQMDEDGKVIHLSEGDGGGHYERCMEELVLPYDPVNEEIFSDLEIRHGDFTLLGCRMMDDVDGQNFALMLIRDAGENVLCIFRRDKQGKVWEHWLSTSGAIPQGKNYSDVKEIVLYRYADGERINFNMWDDAGQYTLTFDHSYFGISVASQEACLENVVYHWEEDTFRLVSWQYGVGHYAFLWDGQIIFTNIGDDTVERVERMVNGDIRTLDFYAQPQASNPWRDPPELQAFPAEFRKGKRLPVYMGPDKQYGISAGGKAKVSTNGDILVMGEYNGFLFIAYEISENKYRFGWVETGALAKGQTVPPITFDEQQTEVLSRNAVLTDDPAGSRDAVVILPSGTRVHWLATLDGRWAYVRTETGGKVWFGFVEISAFEPSNG